MTLRKISLITTSAAAILAAHGAFAQTAAPAADLPTTAAPADANAVGEIVVTGTRLVTGFTTPTPVSTVTNAQLQSRGAVNLSDAVLELPAFRPTGGESQGVTGSLAVGQSLFDLRGLGRTRTLVLVDGKRPVPTNSDGSYDTNTIPTSLVARTDVVTGGASAAYGSDAVAGVVNFVLKDKIDGLIGSAQYGLSNYGDTAQRAGSLGFGTDFDGGRGRILLGGDLSKDDHGPTQYARPWGATEAGIVSLTTRPAGTPANVIGANAEQLLAPGGLIASCMNAAGKVLTGAACPVGNLMFNEQGTGANPFNFGSLVGTTLQIAPSSGQSDYGYNNTSDIYMKAGGERATFLGRVSYDLTPNVTMWGQAQYGSYKVLSTGQYLTRSSSQLFINSNNPYIPASVAATMAANGITQLRLQELFPQYGPSTPNNRNWFNQEQLGFRGTIFGDWKWDLTASTGKNTFRYQNANVTLTPNFYSSVYAVRDASGNIVCGPLASNPNLSQLNAAQIATIQPNCVPTNVFGTQNWSQAAHDYTSPTQIEYTYYRRNALQFNLAGSPINDWAGPVSLAVGAEWHLDKLDIVIPDGKNPLYVALDSFLANPIESSGKTSSKEAYAETGIPLARGLPFMKALDFNAAIRYTNYSPFGAVTTWKAGGTWDVNDILRLRLTRSRDIRAPSIAEAFLQTGSYGLLTNPATGVAAFQNNTNFGNPNLKPEVATTWTTGFVVQPEGVLSGFKASVDYYNIQIDGVIASLSATQVLTAYYLQGQSQYGQFIQLNPNNPLGFDHVSSVFANLNTQKTSGIDVDIDYRAPQGALGIPGRFTFSALGTYLHQLETYGSNGVSLGELAGAIPKERWTLNVGYDVGQFSSYLQAKTSTGILYNVNDCGPTQACYNAAIPSSINKNYFPAAVYYSVGASYSLLDSGGRRLQVFGVIDNLLNKNPPFASWGVLQGQGTGGSGGYDPYDNIGRYFKMGIRFQY